MIPTGPTGWAIRISQLNLGRRMFTWVLSTTSLSLSSVLPPSTALFESELSNGRAAEDRAQRGRKSPRRSENSREIDLSIVVFPIELNFDYGFLTSLKKLFRFVPAPSSAIADSWFSSYCLVFTGYFVDDLYLLLRAKIGVAGL